MASHPAINFTRSRQDEGDVRRELERQETDRLFNERFGFADEVPGLREAPAPPTTEIVRTPELGFSSLEEPPADFQTLFQQGVQIGPQPGQVDSRAVTEAGGIAGVQEQERFKTPGLREINDVISNLLGKASPSQRAAPTKIGPFQKGMLFVADFIAMSEGRQFPSSQIAMQTRRALTLEDQQNRQKFMDGIKALDDFTQLIAPLDKEDRQRAAAGQIERARRVFGDEFGGLLFALASKPNLIESFESFKNNQPHYEGGANDTLFKYAGFLMAGGKPDEAIRVMSEVGIKGGLFTQEAEFMAPALMEAKWDGFVAELLTMGGREADLARRINAGEKYTPAEVINAQRALPLNSENLFDRSVIGLLASDPGLFAAERPHMFNAEQSLAHQERLDKGSIGALGVLIGGLDSDSPGRLVGVRIGVESTTTLLDNGYFDAAASTAMGGGGVVSDTITIRLFEDFMKASDRFLKINASFKTILASSKENTAPGHVAMIFAFMKMLDPGSVVREGEQLTAENARSVPDSIRTWYNRALTGQKLTDTQVEQFLAVAERIWGGSAREQAGREDVFRGLAKSWKISDDSRVVVDLIGDEMRERFGPPEKGSATDADVSNMQDLLGPEATGQDIKDALEKEGFAF